MTDRIIRLTAAFVVVVVVNVAVISCKHAYELVTYPPSPV